MTSLEGPYSWHLKLLTNCHLSGTFEANILCEREAYLYVFRAAVPGKDGYFCHVTELSLEQSEVQVGRQSLIDCIVVSQDVFYHVIGVVD